MSDKFVKKVRKILNSGASGMGPANLRSFKRANHIKSKKKAILELLKARFYNSKYDY